MARLSDCAKTRTLLTGFVEGWLDATETMSVQRHVQSCEGCRLELVRERKLVSTFGDIPVSEGVVPARVLTRPQRVNWRPAFALATVIA